MNGVIKSATEYEVRLRPIECSNRTLNELVRVEEI